MSETEGTTPTPQSASTTDELVHLVAYRDEREPENTGLWVSIEQDPRVSPVPTVSLESRFIGDGDDRMFREVTAHTFSIPAWQVAYLLLATDNPADRARLEALVAGI